jgi:DNA-binding CsgD family transcriptional regulator
VKVGDGAREPAGFAAADPAREVVASILELVPVSGWSFAGFAIDGTVDRLVSAGKENEGWWTHRGPLADRHQAGYRMTPILRGLGRYAAGLTLTFGDRRTEFGALTLLRDAKLGPFSSSELRLLVFALDWASEQFSMLRLMESHALDDEERLERERMARIKDDRDERSALYVLDEDYRISLAWTAVPEEAAAVAVPAARLPERIEAAVRALTRSWTADPATRTTGIARPTPFLVVLTQPLVGPAGFAIGVVLQLFKRRHSLAAAAAQFAMSPREAQVLALVLDGAQLPEIGERLFITASTVQDHIKSLLHKTGAKNRSHMIAQVLGWRAG